jgi:hypothetical protein
VEKSGLQAVSRERHDPITDAESVRLGHRLVRLLGVEHVSCPERASPVVVEIWVHASPYLRTRLLPSST